MKLVNCCMRVIALGLLFSASFISNAYSRDTNSLTLELNKIEPRSNDCLLTFVVSSNTKSDIQKHAYEFVIFDKELSVDRMRVFDFRDVAAGKIKVRQFQLPNTKCDNLGRLLLNDVSACDGKDLDKKYCASSLKVTNKTSVEFLK